MNTENHPRRGRPSDYSADIAMTICDRLVQHAMMAMWWEKVPDTPTARRIMKGWKVADDADYNAGSPDHDEPFYFLEIRIPINRLDLLAKQGLIRRLHQRRIRGRGLRQYT
jgi:hypothetical protein